MNRWRRGAWLSLPPLALLVLPLLAQEPPPAETTPPTAPVPESPADENADEDTPGDDAAAEASAPATGQGSREERVSADNNLSFPVDI